MDSASEKTYTLIVEVVDFQRKKPVQNINVKIFRLEKESITPKQWVENLKNGTPFKTLIISNNTDDTGKVTAELPQGIYEAKVEGYGLDQVCELTQNVEVLLIEPRKHWWQ